jgi:AraC-like DNA-binding protein
LRAAFGVDGVECFSAAPDLIAASRTERVNLVVIPSRDRTGRTLVTTVAAIRASRRSPPVYVYTACDEQDIRELMPLALAGCRGLILRDRDDDPAQLRRLVEPGPLPLAIDSVRLAAEQLVPTRYLPLVLYCLEHITESPGAAAMARQLHVSRRTLSTWAAQTGARGVRSLTSICRVLVALEMLRQSGQTIERVAHELGFGSSANLHNAVTRYTRARPREATAIDTATWCRRLLLRRSALAVRASGALLLPPRESTLRRAEWIARPNDAIMPPTDQADA